VIFVDTGAWFAAFVPSDPDHRAADAWLDANTQPLLTTDFILDELLTLLKRRGEFERAMEIGPALIQGKVARLESIQTEDIQAAWGVFQRYRDKGWSFTDCTSRIVMQRLTVSTAFAFDEHFRQFGTVTVVPS